MSDLLLESAPTAARTAGTGAPVSPGRDLPVTPGAPVGGTPGARPGAMYLTAALAILLLGVLLRLYGATAFPFDQDELYTLMESRDLFDTRLQPGIEARPLYYLLQHPLLAVSQTEAALRVLPTVFGVLGLVVTGLAGARLVGPFAGLGAMLLAAISPWHLYASGTARYFSLVYLLSAMLVWWLPRALDAERPRDLLIVLLVLMTGTATHPTFAIPAAGLALGVTLMRRDGTPGWHWPSRTAWAWLWAPYAAFLITAFALLKLSGNESAVRNWGGRGLAATLRLVPAAMEWMTLPVAGLAAAGAVLLVTSRGPARRVGTMAITSAAGTLLLLFVLSFRTDVYVDYAIGMLPVLFVVGGGAIQWVTTRLASGQWPAALVLGGVVAAGGLPSTASYLLDGSRFDYRPAFARIAREDAVAPVFTWPIVLQRHYAPALRGHELHLAPSRRDSIVASSNGAWVVASVKRHGLALDEDGQLAEWLAGRCRRVESFERPRLDYRMYRVDLWWCDRTGGSSSPRQPFTPAPR